MLNTRKIADDTVLVSSDPREILIRKSGRAEFNKEKVLITVTGDEITINKKTAEAFNLKIKIS